MAHLSHLQSCLLSSQQQGIHGACQRRYLILTLANQLSSCLSSSSPQVWWCSGVRGHQGWSMRVGRMSARQSQSRIYTIVHARYGSTCVHVHVGSFCNPLVCVAVLWLCVPPPSPCASVSCHVVWGGIHGACQRRCLTLTLAIAE